MTRMQSFRKAVEQAKRELHITEKPELFMLLENKPFWYSWDKEQHKTEYIKSKGLCCYNHIINLPRKNGVSMPLFDYQKNLLDALQEHKYLFLKKATGIGATTLFLRWMSWLALKDNAMRNKEMAIVVGPNLNLAIGLISKIKAQFIPYNIILESKQTSVNVNGCEINAYPSNHLDALRSRTDLKVIFCDESDFFEKGEREILRDVIERYISKSDPYLILCSTPAMAGGLFETIEREPANTCLYHRITLDYKYGLDLIYTKEEIEVARQSPSFAREMECQYSGLVGNAFSPATIRAAVKLANKNNTSTTHIDQLTYKSIGVDVGFGEESNTAITLTQLQHGNIIEVIYSKELEQPRFDEIINEIMHLYQNYGNVQRIYVDASARAIVSELKAFYFNEPPEWVEDFKRLKQVGIDPN